MTIIKYAAGTLALVALMALCVVLGAANAQPPLFPAAVAEVAEDDPAWNCWTDGNETCGDTLAYVEATDAHGRGAILPVASDGIVYVSWQDGTVTPAEYWQRRAAFETCVDYAATDGEAAECGPSYANPGEQFIA